MLILISVFLSALFFSYPGNAGLLNSLVSSVSEQTQQQLPYRLNSPDAVFSLDERLNEISGLSLSSDGKFLAAINDEEGVIFHLEKESGVIAEDYRFWDSGDYEGIEIVGKDAWVIKSNGILYRVENYTSENRQANKFNTSLSKSDNVEGLGFDTGSKRLLIACKADAPSGKSISPRRKIYAFDMINKRMLSVPLILINAEVASRFITRLHDKKEKTELLKAFKPEMNFNPSGIAIHPFTGHIYVISATAKMLIVLNPEGQISLMASLDKHKHIQPEGICFDQDGTLYISNEGQNGLAKIYKYVYRN